LIKNGGNLFVLPITLLEWKYMSIFTLIMLKFVIFLYFNNFYWYIIIILTSNIVFLLVIICKCLKSAHIKKWASWLTSHVLHSLSPLYAMIHACFFFSVLASFRHNCLLFRYHCCLVLDLELTIGGDETNSTIITYNNIKL